MSGTLISGPMALGDPKHCVACRLEEGDEGDYEGEEELGPEVEEVRGHGQLHGQPGSTVCLLCLCLGFICLSRSTMPVTVPPQLNKISPLLACGPGLSVASVLPKHACISSSSSIHSGRLIFWARKESLVHSQPAHCQPNQAQMLPSACSKEVNRLLCLWGMCQCFSQVRIGSGQRPECLHGF